MKYLIFILLLTTCFHLSAQDKDDWANLERFKVENSLTDLANNTGRVVFMGNSITEGWKDVNPNFFSENPYINRGIGGQTTPQMLLRFRADVIDLNPEAVVILAGTNDIAGNTGPSTLQMILDNLMGMAEIAEANGIKVILCSVMPAYDYPWKPGLNPNIKIPKLNTMIKAYANSKGFHYLDYFSAMDDGKAGIKEQLTYDGVHLTEAGYQLIEPMVQASINEILQK